MKRHISKLLCIVYLICVLGCITLLVGCVHSRSQRSKDPLLLGQVALSKDKPCSNFGDSFRAIFSTQVINPAAPDDKTPVEGYPGDIAEKVYKDYKAQEEWTVSYTVGETERQQ